MSVEELLQHATQWAEHDPDPATADLVKGLLARGREGDQEAIAELHKRFAGPLMFGTAGLRGEVGAGESCMNRAVVIRATAGLMAWLKDTVGDAPRVVIGCDARHGSAAFHADVAAVVIAAGGEALVLPKQLPTPVTAFAVRHLGADAGVMVTASHNPPADNGYKVYLGGRAAQGAAEGVQIIAPADAQIAEKIAAAPPADEVPYTPGGTEVDVVEDYLAAVTATAENGSGDLKIVLTPMHGVGGQVAKDALERAGFSSVVLVEKQALPDPDFPTVAFPNPEEPGALKLALATAHEVSADVVLALDPDADRLAVAVPDGAGYRQLSGDETGALLGEYLAKKAKGGTLANSIVSGRLLGKIAAQHGLDYQATLTGFKWIARTPDLVFGYEEAIGFCTNPAAARDKDGVNAAVVFASYLAGLKAAGRTVQDELEALARTHGLHQTAPLTFRVEDLSLIAEGMQRLRTNPPRQIAGSEVVAFHDLAEGFEGLPPTEGVLLLTADDDRVIARPSGTEPKLKCYLEVVVPVEGETLPTEQARLRLNRIKTELKDILDMEPV